MFKILSALATHYFFIHKSSICTTAKEICRLKYLSCWENMLITPLEHKDLNARGNSRHPQNRISRLCYCQFFGYHDFFLHVLFVLCLQHPCCELYITIHIGISIIIQYIYRAQSVTVFFFIPKRASRRMFCKHCAFHIMFGVSCTCNEANYLISYKCFMLYLCPHFSVQSYP